MPNERRIMNPFVWWKLNFGEYVPLGFVLRNQKEPNWVRIHSLPNAKRYPESSDEYTEILRRHNAVTDFLFQQGELCYLFKSDSFLPEIDEGEVPSLYGIKFTSESAVWAQYPGEIPKEDDDLFKVWCAPVIWKPSFFDALVKSVADEELFGISIVSVATKNVYCPYDGGADILSFSQSAETVRVAYSEWLSARADGL